MTEDNRLDGKTVILAGGAGGLGTAVADLVASRGGRPVLGCLQNVERASSLARRLEIRSGISVPVIAGDVLEAATRRQLIEAARSVGPLYGLVPLIGAPARVGIEEATEESLLAATRVNFVAPVLLARDFASAFHGDDASIVFVSTMQAVGLFTGSTVYAGPKAALIHAGRILAEQWGGGRGIRVNVVAPGVTTAGMAQESVAAGKYESFIENGVISRLGDPQDVARAVGLFLEPDNYITGQVLTVDGGLTVRK